MKSWSMAINEDLASLDAPPMDVLKALMPAKSTQSNPFRDPTAKSTNSNNSTNSTSTPVAPPPPSFPPYSMHPYNYYHPYGYPPPLPVPSQPAVSPPKPSRDLLSSPIASESDNGEKLILYLEWLAKRTPTQTGMFDEAKDALIMGGHTFETVELLTDDKFEKMKIPEGVEIQIKMQVARLKKLHAKGRI